MVLHFIICRSFYKSGTRITRIERMEQMTFFRRLRELGRRRSNSGLRETENGIETGFTREELQKAIGICGTPTGNAAENRRKEQELRKESCR